MSNSDLQVDQISDALSGRTLDIVVSGSIGAVESVRFIRSLRRLGAKVIPWLTDGGAQFVTETALSWAADHQVRRKFSGLAPHIATSDAAIIAPASASLMARVAGGFADTPTSALIASHLGSNRPVLFVPNMHDSLALSPAIKNNAEKLTELGAVRLDAREEEGKQKFPEPKVLADLCAHQLNQNTDQTTMITMGSTRGYIDDVRYISNYSSGRLGTLISEELYRQGMITNVICASCPHTPAAYSQMHKTLTNDEMMAKVKDLSAAGVKSAVMLASVLDYQPKERQSGKIKSSQSDMNLELAPTEKIIAQATAPIKVGFKLETNLTREMAREIALDYMAKYNLSLFVINDLADVSASTHKAWICADPNGPYEELHDKESIARYIGSHIKRNI